MVYFALYGRCIWFILLQMVDANGFAANGFAANGFAANGFAANVLFSLQMSYFAANDQLQMAKK